MDFHMRTRFGKEKWIFTGASSPIILIGVLAGMMSAKEWFTKGLGHS